MIVPIFGIFYVLVAIIVCIACIKDREAWWMTAISTVLWLPLFAWALFRLVTDRARASLPS